MEHLTIVDLMFVDFNMYKCAFWKNKGYMKVCLYPNGIHTYRGEKTSAMNSLKSYVDILYNFHVIYL